MLANTFLTEFLELQDIISRIRTFRDDQESLKCDDEGDPCYCGPFDAAIDALEEHAEIMVDKAIENIQPLVEALKEDDLESAVRKSHQELLNRWVEFFDDDQVRHIIRERQKEVPS